MIPAAAKQDATGSRGLVPRRSDRRRSGQVLPLLAIMLVAVFGVVGLAVDAGLGFAHEREHHNAADAAALAGAWSLSQTWNLSGSQRQASATQAATAVAAQNNFPASSLAIQPVDFSGAPSTWQAAQGVQVTVRRSYGTALVGVLGLGRTTVADRATAVYGYPTAVSNIVPIQIANDAGNVGKPGATDCMQIPGGGGAPGCDTNFTPFEPVPPCPANPQDPRYDPCFVATLQGGLPSTSPITLISGNRPCQTMADLGPGCYPSRGWDTDVGGRLTYQWLADRIARAPAETAARHAPDSPRVFFATVGAATSGNPVIPVSSFQCLFLDAVTPASMTVTYLDACATTPSPGPGGISKDPPTGIGGSVNPRNLVVTRLIA